MMTIWQTVTWDVARAGGFTAYVLLTLAVAVGLMLSAQLQSPKRWPRLLNSELHNFLSLLSTIFLVVHVLAVWVDPFTHFGWSEVFIPFVSNYRPAWMALGIVGMYLGITIGISTWLRPLIGYTWWRRLHVLTLGIYALATLHAIGTGSDSHTWWGLGIYLVSYVLVGALLCRRLFTLNKRKHTPAQSPARKVDAAHPGSPQPIRHFYGQSKHASSKRNSRRFFRSIENSSCSIGILAGGFWSAKKSKAGGEGYRPAVTRPPRGISGDEGIFSLKP